MMKKDRGWKEALEDEADDDLDDENEEPLSEAEELLVLRELMKEMVQTMRPDLAARPQPTAPPPGRNDPCPCGSGKKFKRCHGQEG